MAADAKRSSQRVFVLGVGLMGRCAFLLVVLVAALALVAAPAQADFGIKDFDVSFTNEDGALEAQAGSHPFAMTTSFEMNTEEGSEGGEVPDGAVKDLLVNLLSGFVGNPTAVPRCSTVDFVAVV